MSVKNSNIKFMSDLLKGQGYSVDPTTGLIVNTLNPLNIDAKLYEMFSIMDRQDAVRRYRWYNLPSGLNGELLERILYYRGQGMFFYMEENDRFYFLPYTLFGNLDVYGEYMEVTPVPFTGVATLDENGNDASRPWIPGIHRKPIKTFDELADDEDEDSDINLYDQMINGCVLLYDYTKGISQKILPRYHAQQKVLEMMSEALPYARTNMITHCGVNSVRVETEDQEAQVYLAAKMIPECAKEGIGLIPIKGGPLPIEPITQGGSGYGTEDYLKYLEALNNLRLQSYGLNNDGIFQKNQYKNMDEVQMSKSTNRYFADGLALRQQFCDLVNALWGLGIWCEPDESALEVDMDGDGNVDGHQEPMDVQTSEGGDNYDSE